MHVDCDSIPCLFDIMRGNRSADVTCLVTDTNHPLGYLFDRRHDTAIVHLVYKYSTMLSPPLQSSGRS